MLVSIFGSHKFKVIPLISMFVMPKPQCRPVLGKNAGTVVAQWNLRCECVGRLSWLLSAGSPIYLWSRSILIIASYIEACGVNLTAREKKVGPGPWKFHPIPAYGPHISWFVHAKILHNTGKSMAKIGRQHLPSPEDLVPTCMIMHPIYQLQYIFDVLLRDVVWIHGH